MSRKQNTIKEIDTVTVKYDFIQQNDAGFSQDRYLPGMNYITQWKRAQITEPRSAVDGDTYYDLNTNKLFVFITYEYQGIGLATFSAVTVYAQGDYVENGGLAYEAIVTPTFGVFVPQEWKQVFIVKQRVPAA